MLELYDAVGKNIFASGRLSKTGLTAVRILEEVVRRAKSWTSEQRRKYF